MADGFFQGGFAEGFAESRAAGQADRGLDLRERALGIEQESLAQDTRRDMVVRADKAVNDTLGIIDGLIKAGREADRPTEQIMAAIQPLAISAAKIHESIGGDPGQILARIQTALESTPGASEAAEAAARANVAGAEATAEALSVPVERAATAQGLIAADDKEAATQITKLQRERDLAFTEGREDDAAQLQGRINNLATITGRTPADVAAQAGTKAGAVAAAKAQEEGRQEAAQRSLDVANIGNLLVQTVELPEGAQGIKGALAETLGGFIGQVDKGLAAQFTEFVTSGATAEEITEFRTKARTAIAANIQTVTGEESGRFTEMERRVTEETLKALQPGASKQQVVSAIAELLKLKIMLRGFALLKAGIEPRYDLNEQGPAMVQTTSRFVRDMRRFGMNEGQIKDLFVRLQTVQSEVGPIFAQ